MSLIGAALALGFMGASCAMNWHYGVSLGRDELSQWTFGGVSIVADLFKAIVPFFIYWSLSQRNWTVAFAGSILWSLCTAYSLSSGLGFAAVNRSDTTGVRAARIEQHTNLSGRLEALGIPRPVDAVVAALAGERLDEKWSRTRRCTAATVDESKAFCRTYHELQGELARSRTAATIRKDIIALEKRQNGKGELRATSDADPQAGILARVLGLPQTAVSTSLMVLVAILVELGSSLGLFVALSHGAKGEGLKGFLHQAFGLRRQGDVARYAASRLQFCYDVETSLDALFDDYCLWCTRVGFEICDQEAFQKAIAMLADHVGFETREEDGEMRVVGMELAGVRSAEE